MGDTLSLAVAEGAGSGAGFLQDCAGIAYVTSPHALFITSFLSAALAAPGLGQDPAALAALCILAANVSIGPAEMPTLATALSLLPIEAAEIVAARWAQWPGPMQAAQVWQWAQVVVLATGV